MPLSPPSPDTYSFGFTAASLRPELVGVVAEVFAHLKSWDRTRDAILEGNALQCRAARSTARLESELRQRLERLTPVQLDLLNRTTSEGRVAFSWLAAVKRYAFLFDFAAEVLRGKLDLQDSVLRASDYESFIEEKAVTHPEVGRLAESTRKKIREVLLRMLREAGLLSPGDELGVLQRPVLPPEVEDTIRDDQPVWLAAFLVPDSQIVAAAT